MIDSEDDLNRFKMIIEREKDNILNALDTHREKDSCCAGSSDLDKKDLKLVKQEVSNRDKLYEHQEDQLITYFPKTFEGMME